MSVITTLVPRRAYRWNFTVMGLDFSVFLLGISFVSAYGVMPLFVQHLTGSNLALGLIPAVRSVCTTLPPILVAPYTERLRRKKPFLLIMTTFERLPYLVLAIATPLLAGAHPTLLLWLFFLMVGVGTLFGGIGMPAWIDLISRMLPGDWRGRFFGLAGALGGLLGVAGAAGAAWLLQRYGWPAGFALCFACTSVCLAVSFAFIAAGREPAPVTAVKREVDRGYWRRLPALVRADRNFARYLLASALIATAGMAVSFYTVDAKRTLGLSDAAAGVYAVLLLGASTLGSTLWGYIGDRLGHKRVAEAGALCTGLAALLALLARGSTIGLLGYAVVFTLVGLATSAIQLAGLTFAVDFAPAEQRPTYIGLANLAGAPFAFAAPLAGGLIADRAGYPAVFALTTGLALAGALIVLLLVVDPRMEASEPTIHHGDTETRR